MDQQAVKSKATGFPEIKRATGERLWFGAVEDAPFHFATFAGAAFTKATFTYKKNRNGDLIDDDRTGFPKTVDHIGAIENFTPERLAAVRADIERYVVHLFRLPDRTSASGDVVESDRYRSRLFKRDDPNCPAKVEPVAKYLFMLPASERRNYEDGADVPTLK